MIARRAATPTRTPGRKARSTKPGASAHGSATTRPASEVVAEALAANPGRTAADLAILTGLGASTVTKALAALEKTGHAHRTMPEATDTDGGRRPAARWQPVSAQRRRPASKAGSGKAGTGKARTSAKQPVTARSVEGQLTPEASAAATADEHAPGGSAPARIGRLGKGELGTLVLEYLIAHPGDELGPTAIGKAMARSQGAVANCLTRLAASGDIVQTSNKPRRFRLAS